MGHFAFWGTNISTHAVSEQIYAAAVYSNIQSEKTKTRANIAVGSGAAHFPTSEWKWASYYPVYNQIFMNCEVIAVILWIQTWGYS